MRKLTMPEPQAICDFSGFKIPHRNLARNWDGAMVDRKRVDKRNPQDFVRGVPDRQALPYARPEHKDPMSVPINAPLRAATPYESGGDFQIRIRGEAPTLRTYDEYSVIETDTFLFPTQVKPEDL